MSTVKLEVGAWWFNRSQEICDSEDGDPIDMLKAHETAKAWLAWGAQK